MSGNYSYSSLFKVLPIHCTHVWCIMSSKMFKINRHKYIIRVYCGFQKYQDIFTKITSKLILPFLRPSVEVHSSSTGTGKKFNTEKKLFVKSGETWIYVSNFPTTTEHFNDNFFIWQIKTYFQQYGVAKKRLHEPLDGELKISHLSIFLLVIF